MFYWRFFWFVANHVPYTRLVINSKLNFYWLHGYKIFDEITNIGGKGTSFSAEKQNSNFVQSTGTSWSDSFPGENVYMMLLSWQYQLNLTFTSYTLKDFSWILQDCQGIVRGELNCLGITWSHKQQLSWTSQTCRKNLF